VGRHLDYCVLSFPLPADPMLRTIPPSPVGTGRFFVDLAGALMSELLKRILVNTLVPSRSLPCPNPGRTTMVLGPPAPPRPGRLCSFFVLTGSSPQVVGLAFEPLPHRAAHRFPPDCTVEGPRSDTRSMNCNLPNFFSPPLADYTSLASSVSEFFLSPPGVYPFLRSTWRCGEPMSVYFSVLRGVCFFFQPRQVVFLVWLVSVFLSSRRTVPLRSGVSLPPPLELFRLARCDLSAFLGMGGADKRSPPSRPLFVLTVEGPHF